MDDYVKRSDVHKVFQPKYAPAINRTFAAMIDSVPAADVVERPRWIPVGERLPEIKEHHVSDTVLVYLADGGMAFDELEENIFGQSWFSCEHLPDVEEEMRVTHWMSLPELPKEET